MENTQNITVYDLLKVIVISKEKASELLLKHQYLLEAKTDNIGETALHYCAIENMLSEVEFLIEKGANVNTVDDFGGTPLINATQLGYLPMVQLLVKHGAELNTQNENEETAIFIAAQNGYVDIVDFLLSSGADPLITDEIYGSIYDVLLPRKKEELTKVLQKYGYNEQP